MKQRRNTLHIMIRTAKHWHKSGKLRSVPISVFHGVSSVFFPNSPSLFFMTRVGKQSRTAHLALDGLRCFGQRWLSYAPDPDRDRALPPLNPYSFFSLSVLIFVLFRGKETGTGTTIELGASSWAKSLSTVSRHRDSVSGATSKI